MSGEDLQQQIEALKADFAKVNGKPFEHFYCPILQVDEPYGEGDPGEVIKGHVIPEALGGRIWVPQRADVDNFYGHAAEADFIGIVLDRPKGVLGTLLDPTGSRRQRPRFETSSGSPVPHYPMKAMSKLPQGHAFIRIIGDDANQEVLFGLKTPDEGILPPNETEGTVYVVIEQDYQAAAAASAIKAAHLTCFKLFGYQYVFSCAGTFVSSILRDFFLQARNAEHKAAFLEKCFKQHYTMVLPMNGFAGETLPFQGTLFDGHVMHCLNARGLVFAIGIIIKAGPDLITVFLPGESNAIDTYFSFLKRPPESMQIGIGPLFPLGGDPNTRGRLMIGGRDA